jgi:hypothetical protein
MRISERLGTLPPHVLTAIKKIDLPTHALQRAYSGACYFDEHAPLEWRLRLMKVVNGRVLSNVNFTYNKDYPLALAYEESDLLDGYVPDSYRWVHVAERLGFEDPPKNDKLYQLGFREREHRVDDIIISSMIDGEFLNDAWGKVLGDFYGLKRTRAQPHPGLTPPFSTSVKMLRMSQGLHS